MLKSSSAEFFLRKSSSGDLNLLVGSPVGSGAMRQRYYQGYASTDEDAEEDTANSEAPCPSMSIALRAQTWTDVLKNVIWIGSAAFIIYYGDRNLNLVSLMWRDQRIIRMALNLGLVGVALNVCLILYTIFCMKLSMKSFEKYEVLPPTAPVVMTLSLFSFCSFAYALWPIWSFLTIPLLITLFMAVMVVAPYLLIRPHNPQSSAPRTD